MMGQYIDKFMNTMVLPGNCNFSVKLVDMHGVTCVDQRRKKYKKRQVTRFNGNDNLVCFIAPCLQYWPQLLDPYGVEYHCACAKV